MFDHVSPIEIPRSSVMRFESSTEMSHSVAAATSRVLGQATVGTDISSATQGSSVASVAGKKRGPTKQCANASAADSATKRSANANAREQLEERSMNNLHRRLKCRRPVVAASFHSTWGGPRERWALALAPAIPTTHAGRSSRAIAECGRRAAETVGGIAIAKEVMQPTQDLMQRLPLLSCEAGAGSPPRLL